MKRLRTKNQLANAGGTVGKNTPSKVTMFIKQALRSVDFDYSQVESETPVEGTATHKLMVIYDYVNEEGKSLPKEDNGSSQFPNEKIPDIKAFYIVIEGMLTDGLDWEKEFEDELLQGAKIQMSQTFGILVSDIEEII